MARTTTKKIFKTIPKDETIAKRSTTLDGKIFITTQNYNLTSFSLYEIIDKEYHLIQKASSPLILDAKIPWKER